MKHCGLLVAVLVATGACSADPRTPAGSGPVGPGAPSASVTASTTLATAGPTSGSATQSSSSATASRPAPLKVTRVSADQAFASPTKNILCFLARDYASCRAQDSRWTGPPRPTSCDADWGPDIELGRTGRAGFRCASDAVPYDWGGAQVLLYGEALRFGNVQCASERDGVRCDRLDDDHGFTLSRSAYHLR